MASQISPGILLRERDITTATIVGAQALTGAFASTFAKGEVGIIVEIDSQRALLDTFGLPSDANAEDWLVASEFLNYGGRLAVVRAETDGILTATTSDTTDYTINSQADFVGQTINELFLARTPGKWGNSAQVIVADKGADVYVEFGSGPLDASQNPLVAGDTVSFSNGSTGTVLSYEAGAGVWKAAIILDDPLVEPAVGDALQDDNEDPIASIIDDAVAEPGRTPGSYLGLTADGDLNGATFDVDVAADTNGEAATGSASNILGASSLVSQSGATAVLAGGGTLTFDTDAGGAFTFVSFAGGAGYIPGQVIAVADGDLGGTGGLTLDITVDTVVEIGGTVTVTLASAGDGYSDNDTLTLLGAATGGGSDITVTVTTTENDTPITAVYDWWTNTTVTVGTQELALNNLGVRPGTSAYAAARGISDDEITVAVVDVDGKISGTVGNVVERISSLSKLSDGRSTENGAIYYKDIINDQSSFIYAGASTVVSAVTAGREAWEQSTEELTLGDKMQVLGVFTKQFGRGADDYAYTASEIQSGYDVFATADQTDLDFILMGGSMGTEDDSKLKAAKVVSIADSRKDCVAFVSPHKGNQIGTGGVSLSTAAQKTNTINFFRSLPSTSYAVFDSGYKQVYDRFNDRFRFIPCNGDVAGLCVNTSRVLADWYSPAGVARGALKNAIKLAYTPSQADRDDLYTNRINPITILPGSGITLFGDKTALASTSAFDRINVRRLFLNLERRVERLASGVLFEQNDVLTRSSFASAVNSYLAEVQARRGVTDFLVVCDETNNTPDVIDRNEFVAEIFVKAARSINFINITFTATKTGVAFSEVVGR